MINTIMFITFLILGCLSIWGSIKYFRLIKKVKKWSTTKGKLHKKWLDSPLYVMAEYPDDVRIFAKYSYSINEIEYHGQNVYSGELIKGERTNLSRIIKKRIQGMPDEPIVHYNPENPKESFLFIDGMRIPYLYLIIGTVLLLCSLLFLAPE